MKSLNYHIDHILYEISKIISSISSEKHETVTDNPLTRIHVNKIENSKIKTWCYLQICYYPESMEYLEALKVR